MSAGPPRLALWLLARRVPAYWRDFVLGDLEEEFHARRAASAFHARWWLWRQTIRCLAAPPDARRHVPPLPRSHGDPIMRTLVADVRYGIRVLARAPSFAARRRRCARAGHRRQHGHLQHRQRRAAAAAALRRIRYGSCGCSRRRRRMPSRASDRFSVSAGQLLRLAAQRAALRRHGHLPGPPVRAHRQRQRRDGRSRPLSGRGSFGFFGRARRSDAPSSTRRTRPAAAMS